MFAPTTTVYLKERLSDASIPVRARRDVSTRPIAEPGEIVPLVQRQRDCVEQTHRIQYKAVDTAARHSGVSVEFRGPVDHVFHTEFRDPAGTTVYGSHQSLTLAHGERGTLEWPTPEIESAEITLVVNAPPAGEGASGCTVRPRRAYLVRDEADEGDALVLRRYTANRVDLDVGPLEDARLLVFTDSYYPGWKALIDGQPVPVLRADDAFKAVVVPAGTHAVSFQFSPAIVYLGLAISILGTVLVVVVMIRPGWIARAART
jgi:hypothetical protein